MSLEDRLKKWIRGFMWFLALALLVVLIAFALENPAVVKLKLFVWSYSTPLFMLALLGFLVGFLVASALLLPGRIRLAWRLRSLMREPKGGTLTRLKGHFKPIELDPEQGPRPGAPG